MRRALAAVALGFVVGLAMPAIADHVSEPTAPVTALNLDLENYALHVPVDCTGEVPYAFDKIRVAMYVSWADPNQTQDPSEHFTAHYAPFWQQRTSKGQLVWRAMASDPSWDHQNAPAHATNGKFDASRLSDIVEVRLTRPGDTGWRKVEAYVTGDVSGVELEDECVFRVGEGP